jgi:two-component system, sensor histidine kinase PdtaS
LKYSANTFKVNPKFIWTTILLLICQVSLLSADVKLLQDSLKLPLHDTIKARLMGKIAWKYRVENKTEAYRLAKEELAIGRKYKQNELILHAYRSIGMFNAIISNYPEADKYYDSCIQLAKKTNNVFYLGSSYGLRGDMCFDQNEYNKGIEYREIGIVYALLSKDNQLIAGSRNNLSSAYIQMNYKLDKAESLLIDALKSAKEDSTWSVAAVVSCNLAEFYYREQKMNLTLKYLDSIPSLMEKDTTNKFNRAQVLVSSAYMFFNLKKYDRSELTAKKAIEIFNELGLDLKLIVPLEVLTKCSIEKNELNKAREYANQLLILAKKERSKEFISIGHELLATIEKKQGNFKLALEHYELYKLYNDTVSEEKKLERIAQMEFKAQTKLKENENLILNSQNINLKKINRVTIFGLICFVILGGFLFWNIRAKNKLNNLLFQKNKLVEQQVEDKSILLQEVHHRVKNNLTMITSLLYLQSKEVSSEDTKNVLTEFQHRIRSIAIVHTKLYEESNISSLDFNSFIQSIFDELLQSYHQLDKPITLHIFGNCSPLDITKSITMGLIFNELFTNSIKHAFTNAPMGVINIDITEINDKLTIFYSDSGSGFNDNLFEEKGNFGFKLLHLLPKQINGHLKYYIEKKQGIFQLDCIIQ